MRINKGYGQFPEIFTKTVMTQTGIFHSQPVSTAGL
jgi:hypothetical protein